MDGNRYQLTMGLLSTALNGLRLENTFVPVAGDPL